MLWIPEQEAAWACSALAQKAEAPAVFLCPKCSSGQQDTGGGWWGCSLAVLTGLGRGGETCLQPVPAWQQSWKLPAAWKFSDTKKEWISLWGWGCGQQPARCVWGSQHSALACTVIAHFKTCKLPRALKFFIGVFWQNLSRIKFPADNDGWIGFHYCSEFQAVCFLRLGM